jgi:hypothetical protein
MLVALSHGPNSLLARTGPAYIVDKLIDDVWLFQLGTGQSIVAYICFIL